MSEGLQNRYRVEKIDDPEGKHAKDQYFVLDPAHDVHSVEALRAYARSVREENEALADDLVNWADQMTDLLQEDDVSRGLTVEEMEAEYRAWRDRLHDQQRALLAIWHMAEPGDTKYMTYDPEKPQEVVASVKEAFRVGQETIDGLYGKVIDAFEDADEYDLELKNRVFEALGIKEGTP